MSLRESTRTDSQGEESHERSLESRHLPSRPSGTARQRAIRVECNVRKDD